MSLTLEPRGYRVLIKTEGPEETTAGGIVIPRNISEREEQGQTEGTLVAMGAGAFPDGDAPELGSRVMYARYAGQVWDDDEGNRFRIVNSDDIVGVIKGESK